MKKLKLLMLASISIIALNVSAQQITDSLYQVKGFAIAAPRPNGVADFVKFINEELAPRKVNTLILRVDYNYEFKIHPELRDSICLSKKDVKKIVAACKDHNIAIIPQINLLGHQSWASKLGSLLKVYPEFDETPWIKMPATPAEYKWPNADGLYCKSYCPLHPSVHKIVFDVMDEVLDAFEAKAFHAGMDEVFYLGETKCPRCAGRDKAVLFANEVQTIRDHLAEKGRELWIWGDRLIDGRTTGIGQWAASYNDTWKAIDMIPRDVVICDWQYDRDNQTAVYFAMKGLRVVTCAWNRPNVALSQVDNFYKSRLISGKEMKPRFYGIAETIWSTTPQFLDGYYGRTVATQNGDNTPWDTFRVMFAKMAEAEQTAQATTKQ
ncbi:family 20 glycosylhydrolase [Mucilaginibacter sp. L3T2-6]|uniref:family 20 glycosylhydrolase n=1 Tax=Mucilaginibacter sp. L3T2-6 TaxID=3062491 RepID=UPI0026764312|nr:family 20 glycosylhydrolase [Mucilaginibacter sp. L3T2-6]MDO3644153.1 family 20 glycosylhydrolase [Mucilaginibacter sp. L3T2-6]MDV6216566.1 family 20 glycosylhydrolase [Mucilaginibacter sp. L3T2-6]